AAVQHFFLLLRRGEAAGIGHGSRLLARLGAISAPAAKALLQQLVEGALRGGNAELFGAGGGKGPRGGGGSEETGPGGKKEVSLLETNRRFTASVNFSGGVWSVFHAGVIGRGLKAPGGAGGPAPEELDRNLHVFLSLLLRVCCRGGGGSLRPQDPPPAVNPEAAKAVAAALVESVCPEAAGGGELLWPPPEEQSRGGGTVERDLRICRVFR
ncbi:INT5 protein, partial [Rostratula benghalensis]|nr:INT5 protein [Rostratula benghalensis]